MAARSWQPAAIKSVYGGLEARAGWQPVAIKSVYGGLETVWAGSPQRSKAVMEALRPCGLAARSDQRRLWRP